jgi:threonine/homoserine/homoserine lactone efflux protein
MTSDQVIAFFVFSLVAAITPGPSNVMIAATGSAVGAARGVSCALGAAVGMAALLFCAALGLGQAIADQPTVLRMINWCGSAFLLWLAWRIATAGRTPETGTAKPVGFLQAAAFQWVNPKGWLVAVGAAGTYLQATANRPLVQAMTFAALFFAAAFPSGLVWLTLGAMVHRLLRHDRTARIFNVTMGLSLAASVVLMLR